MKDLRKIAASVPDFYKNFELDERNFSLTGEVSTWNNGGIRIVFRKKPVK